MTGEDELAADLPARSSTYERSSSSAVKKAVSRAPASRARCHRPAVKLVLRFGKAGEGWRTRHRDTGGDPAPVESNPDRTRVVLLQRMRED